MNRSLWIGGAMTLVTLIIAFFGYSLPFVDSEVGETMLTRDSQGRLLVPPIKPSLDFPFGSDYSGRDLLSRIVMGAKETIGVVTIIASIRLIIGLVLSILSYYFKVARGVMELWNRLFTFMPSIFFIIVLLSIPIVMFSEYRNLWAVFIISIVEVGRVASIFFETMKDVERKPFMEAAIATGGTKWSIFKRHQWPTLRGHVVVQASSEMARTMFLIAQLGIINIFISQIFMAQSRVLFKAINTSNAWPTFFERVQQNIFSAPWIPLSACGAIAFVILGFYLLAEGLQQRMLLKQRKIV